MTRRAPRTGSLLPDMMLDWVSQDPKPSASVLQGLFFGRVAPPSEERRKFDQPTLVIGHYRDPIHPFSDSDMLVRELPNARLVQASSFLELRLTPERLTGEIVQFIERCFKPAAKRRRGAPPDGRSRHAGAPTRPASLPARCHTAESRRSRCAASASGARPRRRRPSSASGSSESWARSCWRSRRSRWWSWWPRAAAAVTAAAASGATRTSSRRAGRSRSRRCSTSPRPPRRPAAS